MFDGERTDAAATFTRLTHGRVNGDRRYDWGRMTPPTLDYATPSSTPPPSAIAQALAFTEAWFIAFATIPTLSLALVYLLPEHTLEAAIVVVLPCGAIAVGFWPALLIEHLIRTRPSPATLLRPWSARYVLFMLSAFIAILPAGEGAVGGFAFLYVVGHLLVFAWLGTCIRAARLVGKASLLALTVAMLVASPKVQRCPHSTSVTLFGVTLCQFGLPCHNPQQYVPWWSFPTP